MKKFWNWIRDDGGGRTLRLEGPIDSENFWGDEITPRMFREDLEADEGDITVWINSPGGNVFAAAEIYTMLRDYTGRVTVKGVGRFTGTITKRFVITRVKLGSASVRSAIQSFIVRPSFRCNTIRSFRRYHTFDRLTYAPRRQRNNTFRRCIRRNRF